METTRPVKVSLKGGEWLIKESDALSTFIPEDFSEEQKMVLDMCYQFVEAEIAPKYKRIEELEPGLTPLLLEKAGEQGLLGAAIPEEYGGLEKDIITSGLISEGVGGAGSFSVSFIAHTGIGTMPILYFGTEAQRQKYLPKLASGEWKGAYGLTEPNSGSDALSAKTIARLSNDKKHYILNGQKCWISNGGFADVFTVFAKIDGEQFTAFIVERGYEGFTQGAEEHKMGIKGSSTVQLFFQDCKVPVENVLGEIGKGHLIAFNILNIGRYKLSAATIGGAKRVINLTTRYAATREQFKTPIARFGAIQHKLAEMAIRTWVCESATYRTASWISNLKTELLAANVSFDKAFLGAAEEYAIECALLKIYGSEMLDYVVDEGVQIYGGNGFSDEYDISRAYRDSRINRIFEGTNEINRLLTVDMLIKRAMKGKLDLMSHAMAVGKELMNIPEYAESSEAGFAKEKKYITSFKKAFLLVAGVAAQKFGTKLEQEQELIMHIADMAMETFIAESTLLRVVKLTETYGASSASLQRDIMQTYIYDAAEKISRAGKDALNRCADSDEARMMHIGLRRFTKVEPYDTIAARRRIADKLIEQNGYCF